MIYKLYICVDKVGINSWRYGPIERGEKLRDPRARYDRIWLRWRRSKWGVISKKLSILYW